MTKYQSLKKRYKTTEMTESTDEPQSENLPLKREKNRNTWFLTGLQVGLLICVVCTGFYITAYFQHFHANLTYAYAVLGHAESQHLVGQRYLQGKGVDQNHSAAVYWFNRAAEQGHSKASYNLAVAHLQGIHHYTHDLQKIYQAIKEAADQQIPEAETALQKFCQQNPCDGFQ